MTKPEVRDGYRVERKRYNRNDFEQIDPKTLLDSLILLLNECPRYEISLFDPEYSTGPVVYRLVKFVDRRHTDRRMNTDISLGDIERRNPLRSDRRKG